MVIQSVFENLAHNWMPFSLELLGDLLTFFMTFINLWIQKEKWLFVLFTNALHNNSKMCFVGDEIFLNGKTTGGQTRKKNQRKCNNCQL